MLLQLICKLGTVFITFSNTQPSKHRPKLGKAALNAAVAERVGAASCACSSAEHCCRYGGSSWCSCSPEATVIWEVGGPGGDREEGCLLQAEHVPPGAFPLLLRCTLPRSTDSKLTPREVTQALSTHSCAATLGLYLEPPEA